MSKILIVDDEVSLADTLKEVFFKEGHRVDVAYGGKEGLEKAKYGRYDLVVLDMNMPEVTGFDVLRGIRALPALKDLPILICTVRSIKEEVDQAFSEGATDFIVKPMDMDRLVAKVNRTLQRPKD